MASEIDWAVVERLRPYGGIRIEDTVLVTANGCEILTPTSKTLCEI